MRLHTKSMRYQRPVIRRQVNTSGSWYSKRRMVGADRVSETWAGIKSQVNGGQPQLR
jgi:hypothetical protein